MADVVKCSVFPVDGKDFAGDERGLRGILRRAKPARTTVEVKFASPPMKVEIDCIAYKPKA